MQIAAAGCEKEMVLDVSKKYEHSVPRQIELLIADIVSGVAATLK